MEFKLPDLGEGVQEGEITRWLVSAGETVQEDQPLLEVMTDKVTAEIPSPCAGLVVDLLQPEGAVVPVGTPLLRIEPQGEEAARNGGGAAAAQEEPPRAARRTSQGPPAPSHAEPAAAPKEAGKPPRAVPLVRKLAKDLGVDLAAVQGTGPGGRITEADVRAAHQAAGRPVEAISRPFTPTAAPAPPLPREEAVRPAIPSEAISEHRIPLRGLRRRIAERMVRALQTAAPATYVDEVDLTELVALREKARESAERHGVRLTYLPFILKAAAAALREHPKLNAVVDEERGEIVLKREYHLGVACETPEGLLVPVVRDVDKKSLFELAGEIAQLAERARAGQLERDDVQGGSFTITSMGALGGLFATPILNYPEVAILGVHKIARRPVYRGDLLVPRDIAHLSLTFDHRALDGIDAARFVQTLIRYLEDPSLLLFT